MLLYHRQKPLAIVNCILYTVNCKIYTVKPRTHERRMIFLKTIVFSNQKGGVSKTTSANALTFGLIGKNKKVLAVDTDPQGNFSFSMGIDPLNTQHTLYEALKGMCDVAKALQNRLNGVDVLSVGLEAAAADMELVSLPAREYRLKDILNTFKADYDYCVIDTSPTLGLLTMNALTAADELIIPLTLDAYGLMGINQLGGFITNIRKYTNADLKVKGILITKYNERLNITQSLIDTVQRAADSMQAIVFNTKIRESVAVREVQATQGILFDDAPKAGASQDYLQFVDEFLKMEE